MCEANPVPPFFTPLDPHEIIVDLHSHEAPPEKPDPIDDSESVTVRCDQLSLSVNPTTYKTPTSFRHSGWAPVRRRVYDALASCCTPDARLKRFSECGNAAWVVVDSHDMRSMRIVGNYCRDRFCTPCANARSQYVSDTLFRNVSAKRIRFLTLTIKTGDEPLALCLNHLRDSFRKLRQTKLWKGCVTGGVAMTEVKWNDSTQRWHPHIHILFAGKFLPIKALRAAWLKATGDSYIVDIQAVKSPLDATRYVTKYATKAVDNNTLRNPRRLREAITALHGKRTLLLLGTWRRISLKRPVVGRDTQYVTSLKDLLTHIRLLNPYAIAVMHSVITKTPLTEKFPARTVADPSRGPPAPTETRTPVPDRQRLLFEVHDSLLVTA